jgi:hypothetical protein
MKRLLGLAWLSVMLLGGSVAANPLPVAQIGLYGDAAGTIGFVRDLGPGEIDIYVVYTVYIESMSAVRFSAPPPECFSAVHLGDTTYQPVVGDSQSGAWVSYPACVTGSIHVMTISYAVEGLSQHCCQYRPVAYPGYADIESQMCDSMAWVWTHGEKIYISADPVDDCDSPVDQYTWGGIKAMYR